LRDAALSNRKAGENGRARENRKPDLENFGRRDGKERSKNRSIGQREKTRRATKWRGGKTRHDKIVTSRNRHRAKSVSVLAEKPGRSLAAFPPG